jgi:hypothetical protein
VEAPKAEFGYGTPIPEDELTGTLDRVKLYNWHLTIMSQGREPSLFNTLEEQIRKCNQLYPGVASTVGIWYYISHTSNSTRY